MNVKWQSLALIFLVLISLFVSRLISEKPRGSFFGGFSSEKNLAEVYSSSTQTNFSYLKETGAVRSTDTLKRMPLRKWDVLDPSIRAHAVLIQTLDEDFPFLSYQTRESWPMASLTKLMTAVVVLESVGEDKKISITQNAVNTEGIAGGLVSGEVYSTQDLLKIMLLTSSNDAAVAFEDHVGGRSEFIRLLNKKAGEIGMKHTIFHDASGLNDLNTSTIQDLLLLVRYIIKNEPEIFNWTRLDSVLIQPFNDAKSRTLLNINPFVQDRDFIGGKTGTSDAAKENLIGIFSFGEYRVVVIILGSPNRVQEVTDLLKWVRGAYDFKMN